MSRKNRRRRRQARNNAESSNMARLVDQLRHRCLASVHDYFQEGVVTDTVHGPLIYKDNGANILAVAHLDTVQQTTHFVHTEQLRDRIICGQLDDRLGAFILLDFLPTMGIVPDVLLTTGEEKMQSTAQHFTMPQGKDYNWMFQFDRAGTDVVMYQYETPAHETALKDVGFDVGIGSYSDICELGHLGITGFNIGCGYHQNHSDMSHMIISEMVSMIQKFATFYWQHYQTKFPYDLSVARRRMRGGMGYAGCGGGSRYEDYEYDNGRWSYNAKERKQRPTNHYHRTGTTPPSVLNSNRKHTTDGGNVRLLGYSTPQGTELCAGCDRVFDSDMLTCVERKWYCADCAMVAKGIEIDSKIKSSGADDPAVYDLNIDEDSWSPCERCGTQDLLRNLQLCDDELLCNDCAVRWREDVAVVGDHGSQMIVEADEEVVDVRNMSADEIAKLENKLYRESVDDYVDRAFKDQDKHLAQDKASHDGDDGGIISGITSYVHSHLGP